MLYGLDISEFNPVQDWDTLNNACNFVMIRASFGTLRKDNQFDHNQSEARRVKATAGPLGIGYYYYAYPQQLGAVESANFFVDNLGELRVGEVLALDWEEAYSGDHAAWCLDFLKHVESRTGVKPLLYLNQSLMNSHNWNTVIDNGNGLWLAQYDGNKDGAPVASPWPVVAMKQWTDKDTVAGVAGSVDGDTFYGDFDAFYKYGYKAPVVTPVEMPIPVVVPEPAPVAPSVTSEPVVTITLPVKEKPVKNAVNNVKSHLPYYLGGLLVLVNGLVDAGYLNIPAAPAQLISSVLAALGLGVLHYRQNKPTV